MAEFRLTPRAEQDLEEIWRYTVEQWSVAQAESYVGGLFDAMESLARDPSRGRPAEGIRAGYLKRNVGTHVVFYQRAAYGIAVVRVLHQRMDVTSHFEADS